MMDVLLCGDPHPPNHIFKKGMGCLLLFNRQPICFYNNSVINGTGDMPSKTIKMKIARDELVLSGIQVPTITPEFLYQLHWYKKQALLQHYRRKKCKNRNKSKNKPIKKGVLIEENQIFSQRTPPLSLNKNNGGRKSINY